MEKKVYVVDGSKFSTLREAAAEFTQALGWSMDWHGGLDAFNDFLHGGFGTPDEGFILVWRHSDFSRQRLGYDETLRWYESRSVLASQKAWLQERVAETRRHEGQTLFDMLVQIIRDHSDIELRLE